ncbi:MAG: hypothetical protein KatS3mg002_0900 [Candidatus Woesearchaeota archaeon]|nr:MAG: hypothetical protein KatS3mg002_0900 [Candidatus Woesearchaeota archaeon]
MTKEKHNSTTNDGEEKKEQEYTEEQYRLAYQIEQLKKVIETIETQINEVVSVIESLEEYNKLKEGDEILFPIANGIFASGYMINNKKIKINVGNNVVVEKTIDETIELMNKQLTEMKTYKRELNKQLEVMLEKIY